MPDGFHCIAIDMPGHGESIGFKEDHFLATNAIDKLKEVLNSMS